MPGSADMNKEKYEAAKVAAVECGVDPDLPPLALYATLQLEHRLWLDNEWVKERYRPLTISYKTLLRRTELSEFIAWECGDYSTMVTSQMMYDRLKWQAKDND
jgi:hypothetical protein